MVSDSPEATSSSSAATLRNYLAIEPGEEPIDSTRLQSTFRKLHAEHYTIEWLVVSDGDSITYYVAAEEADNDRLRRHLRALFPDETAIKDVEFNPWGHFHDGRHLQALTVEGAPARSDDWQLPLNPAARIETVPPRTTEQMPFALGRIVEALDHADAPAIYQVRIDSQTPWNGEYKQRRRELAMNADTTLQWLVSDMSGSDTASEESGIPENDSRLQALDAVSPRRTFRVSVRAVAREFTGPDTNTHGTAGEIIRDIETALRSVGSEYYGPTTTRYTDEDAQSVLTDLATRYSRTVTRTDRLKRRLPLFTSPSPYLTVGVDALGHFCLFDAATVTDQALQATAYTPPERTDLPGPDPDLSAQYHQPGLTLGLEAGRDDHSADEIALPPSLQTLHTAWFGKTGAGKSMSLTNAILDNQQATTGADILIDPKGDGLPEDYLRAHYAEHGDLENVYYFDCAETLPAISFFDIRGSEEVDVPRQNAVADRVDHYIEILRALMGAERFDQAVRSPDIIRYLVRALFDPVHGHDAFGHSDLQQALSQMREEREPPKTVDDDLAAMLEGVVANSKRSFDELMQGVANRIEKIPLDPRLGTLFDHTPTGDDPTFEFEEILDEDAVVIFDTGNLRPASREALTLVLLSSLWTALKRRAQTTTSAKRPLVNLYLEEAATVTATDLLSELLSQSRSFDLGITLAMQFPDQLRDGEGTAEEILNNVSTIVTGNVPADDGLPRRFATAEMDAKAVGARLRALERGEWFVTLPSSFGTAEPRPFLLDSTSLPPGHTDGDRPLTTRERSEFSTARDATIDKTQAAMGLPFESTSPVRSGDGATRGGEIDASMPLADAMGGETTAETSATDSLQRSPTASADAVASRSNAVSESDSETAVRTKAQRQAAQTVEFHTQTTLPHTERFPECIRYDSERHSLICADCTNHYDPTSVGIQRAINCCHSLDDINRNDIPAVEINLNLSRVEQATTEYTPRQLCFLKVVYAAQQRRYDEDFEYDVVRDSMNRLQEYVGIDDAAITELVEADLLRDDASKNPHQLYSVSAAGRETINATNRNGLDHGEAIGDLAESSLHVMAVELGRRYLETEYVRDVTSPVVETASYYGVESGVLDAVGLDDDGEVVLALEAERINHDVGKSVPSDYDKMAAQDPDEAIWVAMGRSEANTILEALNDPVDGNPRIDRTYSAKTAPSEFRIDQPGFTMATTVGSLKNQLIN